MRNVLAQGPQGPRRDGRRRDPHDLRPAHRPAVRAQLETVASCSTAQFPAVADHAARRQGGDHRLRRLPRSPLAQDLVARTRWSGSTKRSSAAPTSWASSPTPHALLRLATCVLIESHDEWQVAERRYLSEDSMAPAHPASPDHHHRDHQATGGDRHRRHPHGIVHNTTKHHAERVTPPDGASSTRLTNLPGHHT